MIPEFFQSPDPTFHIGILGPIIGILIVFLGTCVGIEIRFGQDDDEI
tara:strand:+ start:1228 stop:1368 length:141 start_codon:yes stop_codon:yes gene_type:complete